MSRRKSKCRHDVTDHGPGLIPPAELWGRVLTTGPLVPDAVLPVEERVERAWRRLKAGFQEDEHQRLREVLAELIATPTPTDVQPQEQSA
jgi:hypothetical protein